MMKRMLDGWIGTRYRHRGRNRGGVDCVTFVMDRLCEIHGLPMVELPEYALDAARHTDDERLMKGFIAIFGARFVPPPPRDGDILLFNPYGRVSSHCGLYCKGKIYHALQRVGVIASRYSEEMWRKRLTHIMRVDGC